jgi:hypothetical protein
VEVDLDGVGVLGIVLLSWMGGEKGIIVILTGMEMVGVVVRKGWLLLKRGVEKMTMSVRREAGIEIGVGRM